VSVRIRLRRMGAKKRPFYRIVVADSRKPRGGRYIESLGHYDPMKDPPDIRIEEERLFGWLSNGAQPTTSVQSLLSRMGLAMKWELLKRGEDISQLEVPRPKVRAKKEPQAPQAAEEKPREAKVVEVVETPMAEKPAAVEEVKVPVGKKTVQEKEATEQSEAIKKEAVAKEKAAVQKKPKKSLVKKDDQKAAKKATKLEGGGKASEKKASSRKGSSVAGEKKPAQDDA